MATQPFKAGRLGGSSQNSYAGRLPSKRFVQGVTVFHRISYTYIVTGLRKILKITATNYLQVFHLRIFASACWVVILVRGP